MKAFSFIFRSKESKGIRQWPINSCTMYIIKNDTHNELALTVSG